MIPAEILINMDISHFDEKSGIVPCNTEWGRWWQTVDELHIEVTLPVNTKSKDVKVNVTNSSITCQILGKTLFSVSFQLLFHMSLYCIIYCLCLSGQFVWKGS